MASYYSTQYNLDKQAPSLEDLTKNVGKKECWFYSYTVPAGGLASGSILHLRLLPAGQIFFLPKESYIQWSDMGTGTTFDIGHAAYTGLDGAAVAADDNLFDDDVDVATSASEALLGSDYGIGTTTTANGMFKEFNSKDGVPIIVTNAGSTMAAAATVYGYLSFVR